MALNMTLALTKKVTTLYIDDNSIRLMVTRGKRIIKLAEAPLDMSQAEISAKVREAELVTKIRHLLKTHKIRTKKVIIGLSGLHCLSRPVVLPQLPKSMLDEAMEREAKRIMPVPLEQLYISWQIISTVDAKMQAFIVGIPRQIADALLGVMHQVGLKPYIMDVKPLALARLIKEATAIIIDIQPREFDIVIVAGGIPQPIRTVPLPEEALSLPDKLSIIKDELRRTVQFYNSNNPEKSIQPGASMYVSGELADEPELYESLANELGYQVLSLASPLKCPKQLDPAHYLVNIGLALKELVREAGPLVPNVNALPVPYQPQPISWRRVTAIPVAATAIGLIALLVMVIQDSAASIDSVHGRIATANFAIEQRQSQKDKQIEDIATMEQKLSSTQAACSTFNAVIDDLIERGDVINGDLVATVDNLVLGINLSNISHSGRGLSIQGESPSEVEVLEYARNLRDSGRFEEVVVSRIARVEGSSQESEGEDEEIEDEDEEIEGEGEEMEGNGSEGVVFNLSLKLKGIE